MKSLLLAVLFMWSTQGLPEEPKPACNENGCYFTMEEMNNLNENLTNVLKDLEIARKRIRTLQAATNCV